jgi:hypothetical protein
MKKRTLAAGAAGLALAAAAPVAVMAPAVAETCLPGVGCFGGSVSHLSDSGYDAAIVVFCNYGDAFPTPNWNREKYVAEGTSSRADCGTDTDVIWVRRDEQIACREVTRTGTVFYTVKFDAYGGHKITDNENEDCVVQRD